MSKALRNFFFCWLGCWLVFSLGLFYVAQIEALEYTAGAALLVAVFSVLAVKWKPLRQLLRGRPHSPTARSRPLKILGRGLLGVYIAGTWVYGSWYVWEHWQGFWGFGTLAWHGFMRAIVWPVWVALALV